MKVTETLKLRLQADFGGWAVVTGASSGIGKELATRLAEAGFDVVLNARREPLLKDLATRLEELHGIKTRVVASDLSEKEGINTLLANTKDLDVGMLILCAGFGTSGSFLQAKADTEVEMLRVNCEASLVLTHQFGQRFKERGKGAMVLMSSIVAFQGVPGAAHYAATKGYIQSLVEGLRKEFKKSRIAIISAAPGPVHSGFANRANMKITKADDPAAVGIPILRSLGRKTTAYPGAFNKFLVASLSFLPRKGKVWALSKVMEGMTKHQSHA